MDRGGVTVRRRYFILACLGSMILGRVRCGNGSLLRRDGHGRFVSTRPNEQIYWIRGS